MLLLVFLIIFSLVSSRKLTPEENEKLKSECGQRSMDQDNKRVDDTVIVARPVYGVGQKRRQDQDNKRVDDTVIVARPVYGVGPQRRQARSPRLYSFGGRHAKKLEFPYIVGILNARGDCSGVQISKRHILTAAHCVVIKRGGGKWTIKPAKDFTVYVGNKCLHPLLCDQDKPPYKASRDPMPYEGYDEHYGDIAIIELDRDIPQNEGRPVCMPERDEPLEKQLTAIGYGRHPTEDWPLIGPFHWLQAVQLNFSYVDNKRSEIVTSNKDRSTCSGDSGGPLIKVNQELKDVVVGITSKGYNCKKHYSVWRSFFTDVRNKVDWICERTGVCPIEAKTTADDYQAQYTSTPNDDDGLSLTSPLPPTPELEFNIF